MRRFVGTIALALALASQAHAETLWSITWKSDVLPCDYWTRPMTSAQHVCPQIAGSDISICPQKNPMAATPYDQGKPITIRGYQIVHVIEHGASGYMALGSGHNADGADVFALAGGVGTHDEKMMFGDGLGIPQGARADDTEKNFAHIDVYGMCNRGEQQTIVNILYSSP